VAASHYRFLANDRFAWNDLSTGWHATTVQTLPGQSLVYVAHDTTTFSAASIKTMRLICWQKSRFKVTSPIWRARSWPISYNKIPETSA
jgi:hypothetical protein